MYGVREFHFFAGMHYLDFTNCMRVVYVITKPIDMHTVTPLPCYSLLGSLAWDWMKIWNMDGCSSKCIQSVHKLGIYDILTYHDIFAQLPKSVKGQWLLDFFRMNTSRVSHDLENSTCTTNYIVCGKSVCFEVWMSILGVSQSYYYKSYSLFKSGVLKAHTEVSYAS